MSLKLIEKEKNRDLIKVLAIICYCGTDLEYPISEEYYLKV